MSSGVPYGYRIRNGIAEPDPEEAPRLQLFFKYYLQGSTASSAARIAGISRTSVCCRNMLKNPVYCGTDYYPQLISPVLMKAVEEEIEKRRLHRSGKKAGRKRKLPYPAKTAFFFSPISAIVQEDPALYAARLYNCIQSIDKKTKGE